MAAFTLHTLPLDPGRLRSPLERVDCGGFVSFEGWVRDHNEGQQVLRLEYEAYAPLALSEGERILEQARVRFGVAQVHCAHRVGELAVGELAVWVGVVSAHRGEAFDGCRFIIDEIKHRVPIWKKEYYVGGDSGWVNCERCASTAHRGTVSAADHAHEHATPRHR